MFNIYNEFKSIDLRSIGNDHIQNFLVTHKLVFTDLVKWYSESPK